MIRWLIALTISLTLMIQPVLAQAPTTSPFNPDLGFKELRDGLPHSRFDTDIKKLVAVVLDVMSTILVFLALAGLIISGIMYITASGDEDKAKRARQNIVWIIIGILIYILAFWFLYTTRTLTDCFINSYQFMYVQQFMFTLWGAPPPC